jgi:peroxiredoxin
VKAIFQRARARPLVALAALAMLVALGGCRHAPPPAIPAALSAPDGARRTLAELAAAAPVTVLVFVSEDCPCLGAHLERLRALAGTYAARGVRFYGVDSEVGATPERAAAAAKALGLPFPILVDPGARLANELGAEYATFTVIVDRAGRPRYRGGLDSDRRKLHEDAAPYVADAIDDLLAGRPPRRAEAKTLGCSLRKW